jgi:hypothetical protein
MSLSPQYHDGIGRERCRQGCQNEYAEDDAYGCGDEDRSHEAFLDDLEDPHQSDPGV